MSEAIKFPDRGKTLRESIGRRLNVIIGRGRKVHPAFISPGVYHSKALGDVFGVTVQTFCGLYLEFKPFDESALADVQANTEPYLYRESEDGDRCDRCSSSMGAMMLGRSRKREYGAAGRPLKTKTVMKKVSKAVTVQGVRDRRDEERRKETFFQECFGVSSKEAKRRGIVTTGRGRGTKYRLGDYDGSDNPAA